MKVGFHKDTSQYYGQHKCYIKSTNPVPFLDRNRNHWSKICEIFGSDYVCTY